MNKKGEGYFVVVVFIFWLGILAGLAICSLKSKETLKVELEEQGHAEYYLDDNNSKQWRIKENDCDVPLVDKACLECVIDQALDELSLEFKTE